MNLVYSLSDKALRDEFVLHADGRRERTIVISADALSTEQRKLLIDEWGSSAVSNENFYLPSLAVSVNDYGHVQFVKGWVERPITTADEWFALLDEARRARQEMEQRAEPIRETQRIREEEARRRSAEARRQAEAERAQRQAEAEAEKARWISEHGSARLRKAFEAGYDCIRLYLLERAAHEYPGFVLDFDDKAEWKSRACPSERALDIEEATKASHPHAHVWIVWLTKPPCAEHPDSEGDYDDRYYEPREAVVVRDPRYEGRDLVMSLEDKK